MRKTFAATLFTCGIFLGLGVSEIIHAQAPSYATKQIIQTDEQPAGSGSIDVRIDLATRLQVAVACPPRRT
jgi:hypothetical protein